VSTSVPYDEREKLRSLLLRNDEEKSHRWFEKEGGVHHQREEKGRSVYVPAQRTASYLLHRIKRGEKSLKMVEEKREEKKGKELLGEKGKGGSARVYHFRGKGGEATFASLYKKTTKKREKGISQ